MIKRVDPACSLRPVREKVAHMSVPVVTARGVRAARILGTITLVAGIIFVLAGASTWFTVRSYLVDEQITISEDAAAFQGQIVNGPIDAWVQANIIAKHALEASGGKTYAQLDREDPVRVTVMNGSFLRASLFTSVLAFGVSALVMGAGVLFALIGWALRALAPKVPKEERDVAGTPVAAPPVNA
jgi:hypothetical protein